MAKMKVLLGQHRSLAADKVIATVMSHVKSKNGVQGNLAELCVGSFAILLQELEYRLERERPQHLDVVVALYVYLSVMIPADSMCIPLSIND